MHLRQLFQAGGAGNWSFEPNRVSVQLELQYSEEEQTVAPQILEATRSFQTRRADGQLASLPDLPDDLLTVTWKYGPSQKICNIFY
jgi:hypothetical protein